MNTNEKQRVDVLAVLDEAHDWLYRSSEGRGDDERAERVKCVRAAVAELIEACKEREDAHRELIENIPAGSECGVPNHIRERYRAACQRFDAALARVGGAA